MVPATRHWSPVMVAQPIAASRGRRRDFFGWRRTLPKATSLWNSANGKV